MGGVSMGRQKPFLRVLNALRVRDRSYLARNPVVPLPEENPDFSLRKMVHEINSDSSFVLKSSRSAASWVIPARSFQSGHTLSADEAGLSARIHNCHHRRIWESSDPCHFFPGHWPMEHCLAKKKWLVHSVSRHFRSEVSVESLSEGCNIKEDLKDPQASEGVALRRGSVSEADRQIRASLKEGKWESDIAARIEKSDLHLSSEDISELLLQSTDVDTALQFFRWVRRQKHCEVDSSAYTTLFNILSNDKRPTELLSLVHEMKKNGLPVSSSVLVTIMELNASMGRIDEALKVFESFSSFECSPSTGNYNFILKLLLSAGNNLKINMLFDQMKRTGCPPDTTTYAVIIAMLGKSHKYLEAQSLLKEMGTRGCTSDVSVYAPLIKSLCQAAKVDAALQLFNEMKEKKVTASEEVYGFLVDSLAGLGKVDDASGLFLEMEKVELKPSPLTCISLVIGLIKSGKQVEACSLFNQATAKNYISQSAIEPVILKLRKLRKIDFAWDFLHVMLPQGYRPDAATHYFLVHAFCMAKRADLAFKVFQQAVINNNETALLETYNVLIENLGKTDMEGARQVFHLMKERGCVPDVATYNSVIRVLLKGSLPDAAYDVFQEMIQQNCKGNLVTYKLLVELLRCPNQVRQTSTALNNLWKGANVEEAHEMLLELSRKGLLDLRDTTQTNTLLRASN